MPRRLAITGPHKVEVLTYEDPPLEPDQVRVRNTYASGKHGTTTAMFDGANFVGQSFDQEMRLFVPDESAAGPAATPEDPWGTGTTGVGVVAEVGSAVTRWEVGDEVFGMMDVRETNIRSEDGLWELGDLDPLTALCVEPSYVSFHCIRESNVRYGDRVVIIGLGALGLLAVEMAAAAGAETIIAADPLEKRREWAAANGAHHVFDPLSCDLALEVHKLCGGPGCDVAIELTGKYEALEEAIRCVRICGTVCSSGFYQGESRGLWLGRAWHHNRLTMVVPHGCGWGHPPRDYPLWDEQRAYDCIVSMMRQGKLKAQGLVSPVVTLDEGPEVFRMIEEDPGSVIKYAVRF